MNEIGVASSPIGQICGNLVDDKIRASQQIKSNKVGLNEDKFATKDQIKSDPFHFIEPIYTFKISDRLKTIEAMDLSQMSPMPYQFTIRLVG